ncbi:MAG: transglutaminaseTgpA domain-containing protein [Opitutaceae bacterium]|jgi:transglutaminase-like putative cysteine protease
MSKGEKSPPLSFREFRQLQWLLGCLLVLVSTGAVLFLDVEAWGTVAVAAAGALAALFNPRLPSHVPRWLHRASFPLIASAFMLDFWWNGELLPALIRLDLLLMLYRSISYRGRREDLQLILLGLFLLVVAGVLTVSIAFAAQLLLFTVCALALLLVITIADDAEEPHASGEDIVSAEDGVPAWAAHVSWRRLMGRVRAVTNWRFALLGCALFAGVVVVSGILFVSIPRFQIENSLFLERFISRKARTGFSETVRFGQVSEIMQDNGLALSVDISDPAEMPATPYFRMLVLDEYIPEGGFRLSSRLRQELGYSERNASSIRGTRRLRLGEPVVWTFYLEAGVSRFLPVPGPFVSLRLREPHPVQYSNRLHIASLRQEPVSMLAYRMEYPVALPRISDPEFASRFRGSTRESDGKYRFASRLFLEQPADKEARKQLAKMGSSLAGGSGLSAEEYARRVSEWLARNHGYSLSPRIPAGRGDPLVRWIDSREPGHCELFAGSLVLLARAAGYPARVIVGFKGGTWNAFANGLTVRNSDAHAWCEIWDGEGAWLRVDPTPGAALEEAATAGSDIRERRLDRSWSARLNSLRVFWYRRIVNFDQRTQTEAIQSIKETLQVSRQWAFDRVERTLRAIKAAVLAPWTPRRAAYAILAAVLAGTGAWAWFSLRTRWRWSPLGSSRPDPVRREAGRWLRRLEKTGAFGPKTDAVRQSLQRLRYGAPGTWPAPGPVFHAARQAARRSRKQRK